MLTVESVHEMIRAGSDTIDEICEVSRWPRKNVEAAVRQLNLVIGDDDKPRRFTGPAQPSKPLIERPATSVPIGVRRPDEIRVQEGLTPVGCVHRELVAWANKQPRTGIRLKGATFERLMLELITARRETTEADAARERRETERRAALAEVERLKRELKAAEEKARVKRVGRQPVQVTAASTSKIRAWAILHGHKVGTSGKLPVAVVAAYAAAHPDGQD